MNKEDFKKFKNTLNNFCRVAAEHVFLSFLISAALALLIGAGLFYQYAILAQRAEPQITKEPIQFKEDFYRQILTQWQAREERFGAVDKKTYLDIFK